MKTHQQDSPYSSPWTRGERWALLAWGVAWPLLAAWTPKPLNAWRLAVLRVFGARIEGVPFVHGRARIQAPWRLTLRNRACLGDGAVAYTLGEIELGEACTIAQEAYLCTGTHAFDDPNLPLQTAPVRIGAGAFIGARAFVMPGVTVGARAIVGACAVVTRDVAPGARVAGNPARPLPGRQPRSV